MVKTIVHQARHMRGAGVADVPAMLPPFLLDGVDGRVDC